MVKILCTATVVKTHLAAFHLPYLAWCKAQGWQVHAAAKNDYAPDACVIPNCDHYYDIPFARNPFSLRNLKAYRMLKRVIEENEYDLIHCNTPVGAAVTRLAARAARKRGTKVIYTAHGFHFYKGAPLLNSVLYQSAERLLAPYTDALLTINHEDYAAAKTFRVDRVLYVPGVGIDTARFSSRLDREAVRRSLGLMQEDIMLFSVGELIARNAPEQLAALDYLAGRLCLSGVRIRICECGAQFFTPRLLPSMSITGAERYALITYNEDENPLALFNAGFSGQAFALCAWAQGVAKAALTSPMCLTSWPASWACRR